MFRQWLVPRYATKIRAPLGNSIMSILGADHAGHDLKRYIASGEVVSEYTDYALLLQNLRNFRATVQSLATMKSTFALCMAALAAGQSIPPVEFNLPTAQNNTQLGVAFDQPTGDTVVVQPGALFGKQSKWRAIWGSPGF